MLRIYKASAGSGKTYYLTRQYITYLLAEKGKDGRYRLRKKSHSHHRHILAITFTNKATNEMTQRIIHQLSILAGMPPDDTLAGLKLTREQAGLSTRKSPYYNYFMNPDTGFRCTEEELREAAREALINLLYDYSYFNVSTIDSFFQSVLRMFTREVELPDNYNIELNNNHAITIGIDEMFRSLNYHTIPGTPEDVQRQWTQSWLLDFMHYNITSGNTFNMFSRTSTLYENIVTELSNISNDEFKQRLERLKPYFAEPGKIVKFTTAIKSILSKAHDEVTDKALALYNIMPEEGRNKNFYNALSKLKNGEKLKSDASVTKVATDGTGAFTKGSIERYAISDECVTLCQSVADSYVTMKRLESELRPLIQQVYLFGLLSSITNNIDAYCRDNSLILLSETNSIISGLINDDETPFIYEKLGYYLDHFLIDEFQDTSPMQWANLKPLVMESMSRDKDNLIIGDEKQCIYRFRNSDPRLLGEQVETDVAERFRHHDTIEVTGNSISDNSNWRSSPEIIRFNNTLFTTLAYLIDKEAGNHPGVISASSTYANVVQQIDPGRKTHPGYVKLYLESKESIKPDSPDSNTRALNFMTAEIRRQLAAGYNPGDIAILVRDNRRGQLVINHLLAMMNAPDDPLPHFDIISDDAITLNASQSVRLIISILRLVSIPEFLDVDAKAAAHAAETHASSAKPQSDAYRRARLTNRFQFYRHLIHDDGRPYTASEALEAALADNRNDIPAGGGDDKQELLMKSLLDMECLTLPGVVERIIHTFVPRSYKITDNLFLSTFQDCVIEFSMHGNHDIRSFLKWWDSAGHKLGVTTPANSNALNIMTIHKSKGLEFPCVHIPFANGTMFKEGGTEWVDINTGPLEALGIDSDIIPPALPVKITSGMTDSSVCGEACSNIIAQAMVDELNVNYVAMTRATSELIVYSPLGNGTNFNSMLSSAFKELGSQALDSHNDSPDTQKWLVSLNMLLNNNTVTIGTPTTPAAEAGKDKNTATGMTLELRQYNTSNDALHARACTEPDAIDPFNPDNQRHLGRFLHSVMSIVKTADDLDYAMRKQSYRYRLKAGEISKLKARLERAVNCRQASRWFSGFDKVITERTVTSQGEARRPDRMVWLPDGSIDIVDYKFVDALPAELAVNPGHKKYVNQVSRYIKDITACTGTVVRGYLWYIAHNNDLIVEIKP